MKAQLILVMIFVMSSGAMQKPDAPPPNRFFLRDLMGMYMQGVPLNLASKSKATLKDVNDWIIYTRNHLKEQETFALEFKVGIEDIKDALDILQFEIEEVEKLASKPKQLPLLKPTAKPAAARPVVLKPKVKPAPAKAPAKPMPPRATPVAAGAQARPINVIDYLLNNLRRSNAIELEDGNFIQLKSINQFNLGKDIGPATCPVQALRNTIHVLGFAQTGLQSIIPLLMSTPNALEFMDLFQQCSRGTEWLTADEIERVLERFGPNYRHIAPLITILDVPTELELSPDWLATLQEKFRQPRAVHGFIVGTMDIGQIAGERGHYFNLVIVKANDRYLFLVVDTVPESDHIDRESYKNKRIRYITDLITKGHSSIDLAQEIQKIATERSESQVIRALARPMQFDYASLSKGELEDMQIVTQAVERNKSDWMKKTRLNDAQLNKALEEAKQKIQERLKQFQKK